MWSLTKDSKQIFYHICSLLILSSPFESTQGTMSVGGTGPTKAAAKKKAADGNDGRGDELPPAAIIRERDDKHGTGYEYSPGGGVELRKNRVALMVSAVGDPSVS
jgi:hypothetical protein